MKRFTNILLIFALLFSLTGISSGRAFCKSACEAKKQSCCTKDQSKKMPCCEKASDYSIAEKVSVYSGHKIIVPTFTPVSAYYFDLLIKAFAQVVIQPCRFTYIPPLISRDITILVQVFRI